MRECYKRAILYIRALNSINIQNNKRIHYECGIKGICVHPSPVY